MVAGRKMALLMADLEQLLSHQDATFYFFLCCFISILLVFKLKTRSKPNLPPSPPKLPIIGNLHQLGTLQHRSFHVLSQKYGPLMFLRMGQTPTIVVSSSDLAREIIKSNDIAFANRPQLTAAKILLYGCTDVAFGSYGENWRQKRKICVLELLSLKRVQSFQLRREEEVAELVNKIREVSSSNNVSVNLSEMLIATSNNIICKCVLGKRYNTFDSNNEFGQLAQKVSVALSTFCIGDCFPALGWIDVLTGKIQDFKATFEALDAFFDGVIAEHKAITEKGHDHYSKDEDFVDILLRLQEGGAVDFERTQDVKGLLMDMFAGGSDTVSTTLEWAMAELMRNPIVMKKCQKEVRRYSKSKVDENDINQMSYLKCVVKETLRLHPPAPLLVPHETMSSITLRGYTIPARTKVHVNAWAIQRDPELWEMPEEFIPERFETSQVDFRGQDFKYIPFGSGRRACPGTAFGLASVEYTLANLLYWFDWKLPATVQDLDMSEECGLAVTRKMPLHLEPILYSI